MKDFEKAALIYLAHCAKMLTDIASATQSNHTWVGLQTDDLRDELRKKLTPKTLKFLGDTDPCCQVKATHKMDFKAY